MLSERALPLHLMLLEMNTVGCLQLADIGDDPVHILAGDLGLRRHVSERPMVLGHTVLHGNIKGHIGVVAWIIDIMDQWRALISPGSVRAMTCCTIRIECDFPRCGLGR